MNKAELVITFQALTKMLIGLKLLPPDSDIVEIRAAETCDCLHIVFGNDTPFLLPEVAEGAPYTRWSPDVSCRSMVASDANLFHDGRIE